MECAASRNRVTRFRRVSPTGLTHVATVSFLASRAAPSLQFFFALGGGIALARAARTRDARTGYGAALASMLQTVAVMGPARISAPLTQAITAPMMGRLQARGVRPLTEFAACLALRLVHYAITFAIFVYVILGGLDAFTGSYETLTGWLGIVPQGPAAAIAFAAAGQLVAAICFSTMQVAAYRRALGDWPAAAVAPGAEPPAAEAHDERRRFDPRAVVVAALVATGLLLCSTTWVLLLAVTAWLVPAWLLSRPDNSGLKLGLALAGLLAFAALTGGLLGGAGLELTLRRTLRAVLLVAVATWMRAAAGAPGLRETFRRALHRLRALPSVREGADLMAGLDSGPRLVGAARARGRPVRGRRAASGRAVRHGHGLGRRGVRRVPPRAAGAGLPAPAPRARRGAARAHARARPGAAAGLSQAEPGLPVRPPRRTCAARRGGRKVAPWTPSRRKHTQSPRARGASRSAAPRRPTSTSSSGPRSSGSRAASATAAWGSSSPAWATARGS